MADSPHRPFRPGRRMVVAAVPTTLAAMAVPSAAVARGRRPGRHDHGHGHDHGHDKPTVVLVHGAWADGSGWNAVVELLLRAGYPVRVPPNPLRSLSGDSASVAAFLATLTGPVILAGHSYGGAVITNAATGNANVEALVYVNAFAPEQGEAAFPLAGAGSAVGGDPATTFDAVPYPGAVGGDVELYLKKDVFLDSFASHVPRDEAEVLYATQRPITVSAGSEPSGAPAWRTIPSWYLLGTRDLVITPTAQLAMAQRAGATIVPVKAGHLSLVSDPAAVARLIARAAYATV